jgi:hypothetical protein
MASLSQRKASKAHRHRIAARGMMRLELQASKDDAGLLKALNRALLGDETRAKTLRSILQEALAGTEPRTGFDVFGSDLPDEVFADVFDQPRPRDWRRVEL